MSGGGGNLVSLGDSDMKMTGLLVIPYRVKICPLVPLSVLYLK